jgi:hypothetical protein
MAGVENPVSVDQVLFAPGGGTILMMDHILELYIITDNNATLPWAGPAYVPLCMICI